MPVYSFTKPYYNVAKAANELTLEEAWNCYFEAMPQGGYAIRRRPGLSFLEAPRVQGALGRGLYWSDRVQSLFTSTSTGLYYKGTPLATQVAIGSITDKGLPSIFAEGQRQNMDPIIYVANGGPLHYVDVATNMQLKTITDEPQVCSFITMMNNRFYAISVAANSNQDFYITDVNPATGLLDPVFWTSATNPWRAAQKPDINSAVLSGWNEVYVWGTQGCEPWQEDGVNPISPLIGSLMEIGVEAPYSLVKADNTIFGLGNILGKRAIFKVAGRGPHVISEPIANIIQSYKYTNDAIGSLWFTGGLNYYVLSFPTEGVTWAYDFKNDIWSQWSTWNLGTGQHEIFKAPFTAYATEWNEYVAQGFDSTLFTMSRSKFTDDANNPIKSSVRTGWLDHGTWDRKRSDQLLIKLQGYTQQNAKIVLRTRDDGFPEWSRPIEIEIQAGKQNDHFCKLNRMGMYRSRQYEFFMTDAADLALVGMEEDITRMRN